MIIVEPRVEVLGFTVCADSSMSDPCSDAARLIERAGRVCWKSEGKASRGTAQGFCDRVLGQFGHESISEHASCTMLFVTDRIVSHQLVRHRIAAYSQESTHYLNYSKGAFDRQIRVCKPFDLPNEGPAFECWKQACEHGEQAYFDLIEKHGFKNYVARYALPMALKTELVATYNFRTWKHVIHKRTEINSVGKPLNTPEVHHLMKKAEALLQYNFPEIFKKETPCETKTT